MKKAVAFLLGAGVISTIFSSAPSTGWKLVWQEEFDQTDGFNTTVWSKIPRGRADWQNYMSDYDGLYEVKDGKLILRGMVNDVLPNDTAEFLTGGLYTKDKKLFR